MALRTIIVEDERPSLERLKSMLEDFPDIDLIGEAEDGQSAVDLINEEKPDLTFLDIHLPVFSSFEILERLQFIPHIIFVTAYDQYAVDAFEKNAVDYLLKPTSSERLARAIEKVKKAQSNVNDSVLDILRSAVERPVQHDRFCIKVGDEILFLSAKDVFFFKAEDKYVFLHTFNKNYIYDATLKELQASLDSNFLRIHKSSIIATDKIHKIKKSFSGKFLVQLMDQKKSQHEIGRSYLSGVRKQLGF